MVVQITHLILKGLAIEIALDFCKKNESTNIATQ